MPTAKKVYAMLDNESLWNAATCCHHALADAEIAHAVMGGLAVCLHGYRRDTTNVDFLIRRGDVPRLSKRVGVPVRFMLAGDRAGKGSEVLLPDPSDVKVTTEIDDLPVLTLAKLIESKIACGMGNLRRTHKDYADVVELIVCNRLNSSFARHLHKSLRTTYRELVRMSRG